MKKILLAMAVLFGCSTVSFAQPNLVATLQHEGSFRHFYGSGALNSAYSAAATGDIITLSPGSFSFSGTFNKGITLRGTGFNAATKSYISDQVSFSATDSNMVATIEGIYFTSTVSIQNNASGNGQGAIIFVKDFFSNGLEANYANTYSTVKGPKVRLYNVQCNNRFYFRFRSYPDFFVYNSYIANPYSSSDFVQNTSAFVNCFVDYGFSEMLSANYMNFYNCLFRANNNTSYYFPNTATCNNCVCIGNSYLFKSLLKGVNNKYANSSDVLSEEEGHAWYELTNEAKETYLGLDGTQVGLYGGNYPWNTKVQYPIITTFSSDVQTSKEGILNINVEVDGQ